MDGTDHIAALVGRGARFVLLKLPGKHTRHCDRRADCECWKVPALTGWQHKVPSAAAVEAWQDRGGKVGVKPSSLGCVVLDVDHGDPAPLIEACLWMPEYITNYRTRRGAHLWLGRDRAVSSPKWQAYGCAGDVLDGRRYAVLHGAADDELGEAFAGRPRRTLRRMDPFKGLQLEPIQVPAVAKAAPGRRPAAWVAPAGRWGRRGTECRLAGLHAPGGATHRRRGRHMGGGLTGHAAGRLRRQ